MKQKNKKEQNVKLSVMSIKHTPTSLTTYNISLSLEVPILKKENIEFILEVLKIFRTFITFINTL